MNAEGLKDVLRLHKMWLNGDNGGVFADLSSADLSCAYLSGANLYCADLSGANLHSADLSSADLSCAYLSGADLRGANLHNADLSSADLSGADLSGADLSGADLRGANLREAIVSFSAWPIWCGSLDVKIDARIAAQLVYHVVRACHSVTDDAGVVAFCNDPTVVELANRFFRVKECGKIKVKKTKKTKMQKNENKI